MGGPISKEDSIVIIDKGVGVVQNDLVAGVILAVSTLVGEGLALEGMSMCVVHLGTGFELVECVRTWVGVHQQLQWCVGLFGNRYMEGGGELSNEGRLKDAQLIVKGEV